MVLMSIHLEIGDCMTPEAIPILITLYYHYIDILYWPKQENLKENLWEQWNNTAHRCGQRVDKKSHGHKRCLHLVTESDGNMDDLPNVGRQGTQEGQEDMSTRSVIGPWKIGEEDRSESGQVLENFGLHLGPIWTGFVKIFKTASAGVRTRFWNLGQVRCLSGQKKMMEIFFYNFFLYIY